jgi:hypothetical protein
MTDPQGRITAALAADAALRLSAPSEVTFDLAKMK